MNQKLMAFWGYDLFPQVMLHGEVEKILEKGWVEVKGYKGTMFKPLAILPFEEGGRIAKRFEELKLEYNKTEANAKLKFKKQFEKDIPFKINRFGIK